ncbi:AT-rich interactive domain-containing protein 2 [Medicago truncatula]|uniref:AT-rich interactive domain-containing protein 2 n=1 Tax=Medicago truncatula TaxID=3880 RepID=UPI0019689DB2|nr:AT-rich interactive domain-containing protein 2 [Medicago truncatula]
MFAALNEIQQQHQLVPPPSPSILNDFSGFNFDLEGTVQNFNGDGNEDDNEKFSTGVEDDLGTCFVETSENEFHSRKRKRESLSGMINWTKNIAIHPFDPEEYKGGQDFLDQMLWARDVLSVRKHAEPDSGSSSKKVKKMHPAMYEDPVVKLRCSERQPVPSKPRCSCCISLYVAGNKLHGFITEKKKSTAKAVVNKKKKSKPSVGHRFQVELPQCTSVVYESDSKCLGTQVWPVN